MLKKETIYLAVILSCAILMICAPTRTSAQDTAVSAKPPAEKPTDEKAKSRPPIEQYHLDFSINEIEDGKKINSRQYSMDLCSPDSNEIKIGTRVPVEVKEGEIQYIDVGTNIMARIGENRDQEQLTVRAENSSFAMDSNPGEKRDSRPVIRQLKMGGTVLLPLSKPTIVIGSAEDPNSRREFQLEVTVTKIR
jgi:hypothetical protein